MPSARIKNTELRVFATYQSRSRGNVRYTVLCDKNGKPTMCNCPGFTYHRRCWHYERSVSLVLKRFGVE